MERRRLSPSYIFNSTDLTLPWLWSIPFTLNTDEHTLQRNHWEIVDESIDLPPGLWWKAEDSMHVEHKRTWNKREDVIDEETLFSSPFLLLSPRSRRTEIRTVVSRKISHPHKGLSVPYPPASLTIWTMFTWTSFYPLSSLTIWAMFALTSLLRSHICTLLGFVPVSSLCLFSKEKLELWERWT